MTQNIDTNLSLQLVNPNENLLYPLHPSKRLLRNILHGNYGQNYQDHRVYMSILLEVKLADLSFSNLLAQLSCLLDTKAKRQLLNPENIFVYAHFDDHSMCYFILKPDGDTSLSDLSKNVFSDRIIINLWDYLLLREDLQKHPVYMFCGPSERKLCQCQTSSNPNPPQASNLNPPPSNQSDSLYVNENNSITKDKKKLFVHNSQAKTILFSYIMQNEHQFFTFKCRRFKEIGPILLNHLLTGSSLTWEDIYLFGDRKVLSGIFLLKNSNISKTPYAHISSMVFSFQPHKSITITKTTSKDITKMIQSGIRFYITSDHNSMTKQNINHNVKIYTNTTLESSNNKPKTDLQSSSKSITISNMSNKPTTTLQSSNKPKTNVPTSTANSIKIKPKSSGSEKLSNAKQKPLNIANLESILNSEVEIDDERNEFVSTRLTELQQYGYQVINVMLLHTGMTIKDINDLLGSNITSEQQVVAIPRKSTNKLQLMEVMIVTNADSSQLNRILEKNQAKTSFKTQLVCKLTNFKKLETFLRKNYGNFIALATNHLSNNISNFVYSNNEPLQEKVEIYMKPIFTN